jgi:hypothetical protein
MTISQGLLFIIGTKMEGVVQFQPKLLSVSFKANCDQANWSLTISSTFLFCFKARWGWGSAFGTEA